ncbi:periplasmic murein peptide-binding protein [Escherichia coli]|uniref:Periplasmic murein peptide-binding protein n=1 Tax=Escherichia coli TaxID=562 RepID=A0A376KUT5_ECOLX|nr:periplasmic murein peptide-binding protein [Escherichia coli]
MCLTTQKGPTADQRVRLALSMTIDRRLMTEKVLGTGEKPAWHFTPDVYRRIYAGTFAV